MIRAAVLSCAALLLFAAACTSDGQGPAAPDVPLPTTSPTPVAATPTPTPAAPSQQAIPEPPPRDLFDLARRLGGLEGGVPTPVSATPPEQRPGDRRDFTVVRLPPFAEFEMTPPDTEAVSAVLRLITPHAYFYVQGGMDVSDSDLEAAGRDFEDEIYSRMTEVFGRERSPGIDGDPRITVLHARLSDIGGYFSPEDEFPLTVAPLSNEREMVYVSHLAGAIGSRGYAALLAHELQHLFHFNGDENEEIWVNEGLSEVAAGLITGSSSRGPAFLAQPDTQLNAWSVEADIALHYGAGDLFFRYLAERLGGPESLRGFVATPEDGIAGVRAFLEAESAGITFEKLFADWLVANYLADYASLDAGAAAAATLDAPAEGSDTVHQFAADYVEVELGSSGDAVFEFDGETTVPVLPVEPHGGDGQWWANRGDSIDTTLTRDLDLSGLSSATLTFWTWYDIERWYDYAYVEVSADGGRTWEILQGGHSTDENPVARAYGPGYTGRSGGGSDAVWVEESIDLTPYAGGPVLLRFEYVTDTGLNKPGWAIDDIAVPEAGFFDDAEDDGDWESNGFARVDEPLEQRFVLRLIEVDDETTVTDVALDEENRAEVRLRGFGEGLRPEPVEGQRTEPVEGLRKAVLVIAGATEGTTEPAGYSYSLSSVP